MELVTLPTPTESGYADVNGVTIWYQTYGAGDPLILIHGGLGSVEMCRGGERGRESARRCGLRLVGGGAQREGPDARRLRRLGRGPVLGGDEALRAPRRRRAGRGLGSIGPSYEDTCDR